MFRSPTAAPTILTALLFGLGCSGATPESSEPTAPETPDRLVLDHGPQKGDRAPMCAESVRVERDAPFRQLSWMLTDATTTHVEYRRLDPRTDQWSDWQPVEITFSEDDRYNGRVLLDRPADTIELRGDHRLRETSFSIRDSIRARRPPLDETSATRPRHARRCSNDDIYLTDEHTADEPAPSLSGDLVVPRDQWGAVAPDRLCRKLDEPDRITFHHTVVPDTDGTDPASVVRQIQSYHLNERGWCDIGYHFVIATDGTVFEGSVDPRRLGAHVGDDNEGNVGIALVGDFTSGGPTEPQRRATLRLTRWLKRAFDIPLEDRTVRGHHQWPGQTTNCPGPGLEPLIEAVLDQPADPGPTPRADGR